MDEWREKLGMAAALCAVACPRRTVGDFHARTAPAIRHDQICFAFDRGGRPIAFWTWAFLSPDVEERIRATRTLDLHESEWNEGRSVWIMDFVAPFGYVRDVVSYIRRSAFAGVPHVQVPRVPTGDKALRVRRWTVLSDLAYDAWAARSSTFRLPVGCFAVSATAWSLNPRKPSATY